MKNQKAHYSLRQEAGSNVHKLYIYDDVTKYGDFDWWTWNYSESETSAQHFRKVLEEIPETDVIEVHINSNGGDVGEGVAIYNLLKQKKCKELVAYVDGFAWSVASVILQAADRRVMGLGTSLLIHNMWTTVSGNADQLRKAADDLDTLMEGNRKIYMERVNITEEELEEKGALIDRYYHDVEKEAMRRCILDEGKRLDGRKTTEIRPIWCEVGYLPGPHGSAIFTRGETQSLTSVTLGTKLDEKIVDDVLDQHRERFLLHYNFPPYSTGEAKAQRGVGRREIGHGHLAWRALKGQIPAGYPYTVRVVSDIMESNGSSSMATVCAGTLALMDAGVAMKKPVSGIAMGLIKNAGEEKYAVLSDILGDEDHLGDMDFKVTGTRDGITATQMDIKVDGLSFEILEKALLQAKEGREHILNKLTECIAEPRKDLKPHAPRIETMTIPKEFIGAIIGPGGKIIQGMQEETGATITIEETDGVGRIEIAGTNKKCIDDAMRIIKGIVAVPEVGEVYVGKVRSVMPYGVFVEFLPGKDGLLHISEIDWKRLETIEEAGLKEGDEIEVKLLDIDPKTGKFKLSHKVLLPRPEKQEKK